VTYNKKENRFYQKLTTDMGAARNEEDGEESSLATTGEESSLATKACEESDFLKLAPQIIVLLQSVSCCDRTTYLHLTPEGGNVFCGKKIVSLNFFRDDAVSYLFSFHI